MTFSVIILIVKPRNVIKTALITAVLLLLPSLIFAFEVNVRPDRVAPGDIFLMKVTGNEGTTVDASFLKQPVKFHPLTDEQLIALVPVDVNTKPQNYKLTITQGKKTHIADLTVISHEFKTIHLTLPEGKVTLSPRNQKRAVEEAGLLNRLWPKYNARSWSGEFNAPTDTEISTLFGVKRIMNKKKTSVHRGMDFRGKTGTPVNSINSGTAVLGKDLFYGGNTLIIDHGMGLYSVYMHLSKINVSNGEHVTKGQTVGLIGMSGRATGPHLHLSVKLNGVSVNPESLFDLEF